MDDLVFCRLSAAEAEMGYSIYLEAFHWLNAQGIRQWLVPLPRSVYDRHQQRGENYGLFVERNLAVLVSLVFGAPQVWADIVSKTGSWWVFNLATAQSFRGRKLGEVAVRMATEHLLRQRIGGVYLDCVDERGFLPTFYERLGFAKVCERSIRYSSGNTFPMVLMRKRLNAA